MTDSMTKYNHKLLAEQSVVNFIEYIEEESGVPVVDEDKEWLFEKAEEIFDAYYIEGQLNIKLSSQEDKDGLEAYLNVVQTTMGKMFGHIILAEYKLRLLDKIFNI